MTGEVVVHEDPECHRAWTTIGRRVGTPETEETSSLQLFHDHLTHD
jgi:hypothetical protein